MKYGCKNKTIGNNCISYDKDLEVCFCLEECHLKILKRVCDIEIENQEFNTMTVSTEEYNELKEKAEKYDRLVEFYNKLSEEK